MKKGPFQFAWQSNVPLHGVDLYKGGLKAGHRLLRMSPHLDRLVFQLIHSHLEDSGWSQRGCGVEWGEKVERVGEDKGIDYVKCRCKHISTNLIGTCMTYRIMTSFSCELYMVW